ncbi:MAG TPA: helix-turn-helix transcriptional regulator [Clostridiales bacterium]|nr:helix-turn-helix transcriptional regulator [Clostridiales bacterium]
MNFSDAIKDIRKALNLTQTELANELEVSFSTINRWENGKTIPNKMTIKMIHNFCEKNNVSFKYITMNITI